MEPYSPAEWEDIIATWRRAGFGEYAVDFSFIDPRIVRGLTAHLKQLLDSPAPTSGGS
jgi:hypothetical protein